MNGVPNMLEKKKSRHRQRQLLEEEGVTFSASNKVVGAFWDPSPKTISRLFGAQSESK
jgi:hypothetical protein